MKKQVRNIVRYNARGINNASEFLNSGILPEIVSIDVSLDKDLIENTELEYFLNLERLLFSSTLKPIQIFRVQENQNNINLGRYSVTLQLGATIFQTFLIYTPQNLVEFLPRDPLANLGKQDFTTDYYLIESVDLMIEMINTALLSAFTLLIPFLPPAADTAPFFIFDHITETVDLIVQNVFITTGVLIFVNSTLWPLLSALPYRANLSSISIPTQGRDYLLTARFTGDNSYNLIIPEIAAPTIPLFIRMHGEFRQLSSWDRIEKIILTTSLNVVPEYSTPNDDTNSMTSSHIIADIADFRVGNVRTFVGFAPIPPFDKNIFIDNLGVYRVSLIAKMIDIYGNEFPLKIAANQFFSAKLAFVDKNLRLKSDHIKL